jgi:hypothetical protein
VNAEIASEILTSAIASPPTLRSLPAVTAPPRRPPVLSEALRDRSGDAAGRRC